MATLILSDCIRCGACVPECPNEAISESIETFYIDPDRCTECVGFHEMESCQAICPVMCCLPDPNRRESETQLFSRALKLHPDNDELKEYSKTNEYPSHFRVAALA